MIEGNLFFMDSKIDITKGTELRFLQYLSEIFPDPVRYGTGLHGFIIICDSISDEIKPDTDMSFPLAT